LFEEKSYTKPEPSIASPPAIVEVAFVDVALKNPNVGVDVARSTPDASVDSRELIAVAVYVRVFVNLLAPENVFASDRSVDEAAVIVDESAHTRPFAVVRRYPDVVVPRVRTPVFDTVRAEDEAFVTTSNIFPVVPPQIVVREYGDEVPIPTLPVEVIRSLSFASANPPV
jgi:hypothetical protein